MVFSIPLPRDRDLNSILNKLKEESKKQGVLFEGTVYLGRFAGQGIEGRYWLSNQEYVVQIDKKPILITESRIREEILRYIWGPT